MALRTKYIHTYIHPLDTPPAHSCRLIYAPGATQYCPDGPFRGKFTPRSPRCPRETRLPRSMSSYSPYSRSAAAHIPSNPKQRMHSTGREIINHPSSQINIITITTHPCHQSSHSQTPRNRIPTDRPFRHPLPAPRTGATQPCQREI